MREAYLVRDIVKAVKARYPRAFIAKLADRHTRGLPDLLVVLSGITIFFEVKTKLGSVSPIQRAIHEKIERAGGSVCVVRSVKEAIRAIRELEKYLF